MKQRKRQALIMKRLIIIFLKVEEAGERSFEYATDRTQ